jgi:tRNA-dihydrouridine synthase
MPFLSPTVHRQLTNREARELPYADTVGFYAVPQLLTKVSDDFLWAAQQCKDRGYDEVNLNLGCPSGTVVAKGKGSGMLRDLDALDRFLDAIFAASPLPITVKTRIGVNDPAEFPAILEIYNRYPIKELTVHPRIRKAFYKGDVELDAFRYAYEHSTNPLCYNGDILSTSQAETLAAEFSEVKSVMIGRGLIGDPGMLTPGGTTIDKLEAFLDELLEEYLREFGGSRNAMFRLKENWGFLINLFDGHEKLRKRLFKTTDIGEYRQIVREILHTLPKRDCLPHV